ncbi:hypothetical protein [Streptacidiphilus monticola]|uniref:Uncharacterized protein n=1 Tax=Streptacidiphilus monticola TaxID=2161674 RepID=A0ABW1G5Z2_9ACTN
MLETIQLSRAEVVNARIRALLASAPGGRLSDAQRAQYQSLLDEYLSAARAERGPLELAA